MALTAQLAFHLPDTLLGEGPVWDHRLQKLWWVDIPNGLLHCYDPQSDDNQTHSIGQMVGAAIPCEQGGLILVMEHGFAFFDPKTAQLELISDPESHLPETRFNDGKCDPAGRLWAGTMRKESPRHPVGGLYRLGPDLTVTKMLSDIRVSNGLAWTQNADKLFYIDTRQFKIMSFDYDLETGDIHRQQDFLVFEEEFPDGMCIDENDNLWVAFFRGGKVVCFDSKTGQKLEEITVPTQHTTSCTFGGKNLDTLYITTGANDGDPLGGGLFSVKPGVKGQKTHFFINNPKP